LNDSHCPNFSPAPLNLQSGFYRDGAPIGKQVQWKKSLAGLFPLHIDKRQQMNNIGLIRIALSHWVCKISKTSPNQICESCYGQRRIL
jgi:hypothetical protein